MIAKISEIGKLGRWEFVWRRTAANQAERRFLVKEKRKLSLPPNLLKLRELCELRVRLYFSAPPGANAPSLFFYTSFAREVKSLHPEIGED